MGFEKSMFANQNLEDVENMMDLSSSPSFNKDRQLQPALKKQQPFRKPFANLSTSRGSSTSSLASSNTFSSSNSVSTISSITESIPQRVAVNIHNDATAKAPPLHGSPPPPRRTMRRAFSSNTFSNRNASMINGSLFQPLMMNSIDDNTEDLDVFCVPSPIAEKVTPLGGSFGSRLNDNDKPQQFNETNNNHDFNNDDDDDDKINSNINNESQDNDSDDDHEGMSPSLRREVGSPIQQRISTKLKNARSKVRRTHSMFQNPQDYYNSDRNATSAINKISTNMTALSFDNDGVNSGNATLPSTGIETVKDQKDLIPRITVDEFVKILDGNYKHHFQEVVVIDCRFEYEFHGGHIEGAINISSQSDLEDKFLSGEKVNNSQVPLSNKTLLIFHCEFSSYRGPLMANHLRKSDRLINTDNYPNLFYPDILILEGGYKNFFDLQSHRCYPKFYVQMNDSQHQASCEKQMNRIRRDSKLQSSRSLKKAKSFHVGFPNADKIHMRSRSQTILSSSINNHIMQHQSSSTFMGFSNSSTSTVSRPSSVQRARHSSSLLSLSKHNSLKFSQRSSTHSISSSATNLTLESDEDAENDLLSSYFSGSNRDSDTISSYFESQSATSHTLSSFLDSSKTDFKFPMKTKSNQSLSTASKTSTNNTLRFSEAVKEHNDTPFISHKKQKSSGYLCRTMTQPNMKF